ncbi:ROK family protein [Listeria ivanovii]|uniref:fructokinase n=1 Tax=Listeria ivanovii (strain ATCC BAA-678 / PAM 55) TaxID=881621 RepID=G2ZDB6_LISIP|nr:ROK family protein [Listeria ivanovii]MCJ1716453.1 ROK family protein [Listeria ivanovii]MCJ1721639.1 ROK family protein [Listeria ivanovii]MCJ1734346.1 ROK family protein [Listeria ivanovii]CBW85230.1 Putative fructokinase [Listeria ivanovii subsp. ivanovii PAM 55]
MVYGAIEAGGTKFVVAIGKESGEIIKRESYPTTEPAETMKAVIQFFKQYQDELKAIGIGSFGPIDIRKSSPTYGYITQTPKLAWRNYDIVGAMKREFNVPIGFTTDVNAAALGEVSLGAAEGLSSCIYLTIGTGIGGGAVVSGKILEGFSHPEMGHIMVRCHKLDRFTGSCPSHSDCLEGLAAGGAIEKRWGKKAVELADDEEVWNLEAHYIAQALMNYTLILSPERIILGGGVMKQRQLFPLIRQKLKALVNNYVQLPDLERYIVPPKLEDDAGITGCVLLAVDAEKNK